MSPLFPLLLTQFLFPRRPRWEKNDFHVSGESYAGTYIPNIGSFIHESNKQLPTTGSLPIPLRSLIIGNGLTDTCPFSPPPPPPPSPSS